MRTLLLTLAVSLSGCSLVFMETLPANHTPKQEPRCTASRGWVAWDLVITAANIASGVVAIVTANSALNDLNEDDPRDEDDIDSIKRQRTAAVVLSSGLALTYGASAFYGTRQAGKCEDARAARDAYQRSASGGQHSK